MLTPDFFFVVMAVLKITDAVGREWQRALTVDELCTIGRASDNCVVLNDPRASRFHAHIQFRNGTFVIIDGNTIGGQFRRSVNKLFVNGEMRHEHALADGDCIQIGASTLRFEQEAGEEGREQTSGEDVRYDDRPLGHTQLLVPSEDMMTGVLRGAKREASAELEALKRKADILAVLYEMSKTLSSAFDLNHIFAKATDIIFRVTPADRVVALIADGRHEEDAAEVNLRSMAIRVRDEKLEERAQKMTIGRTITRKVMRERVALLSQDAARDEQFANVESIVLQGVRSTICAPLVAEQTVHGALYADRLDPFAAFTADDLELISAIAAQTAVAVENVRAHERLAREEVIRANYGRFLPAYVVKQVLENPESFKLGGVNQIITVLFADIRGFTQLSEQAKPERVVQLLNKFFSAMTHIIFAHGGTLDKYIGDGLMALFGAPTATAQDAANALDAAVRMQHRVRSLNDELRAEGFNEINVGIGLHTGEATIGYIGSEQRLEYTAIGDTVNIAARLESNSEGGQILLSDATAQAAVGRYPLVPRESITIKNRTEPVPLFEVRWE